MVGTPVLPVYSGGNPYLAIRSQMFDHWYLEIQAKELGMKVEVFDPSGNNIEHLGQPGELVCTRPHVSLPIAFWGDEKGHKLKEAYFSTYPGKWSIY